LGKVTVHEEVCKGCGLCITVCPKNILSIDKSRLNSKGYNVVAFGDEANCIGCAFCARICPDCALEVDK
jgi:2-oxoglutarate ferredoxin oxidoreductase subunit delta